MEKLKLKCTVKITGPLSFYNESIIDYNNENAALVTFWFRDIMYLYSRLLNALSDFQENNFKMKWNDTELE